MSDIKKLFKQSSHFFSGQAAIMAAGFISFPILTRIFSVGDYGILGLITTTLLIAVALAKVGFPGFIVQFYAEFEAKDQIRNFYATIVLSSFGIALFMAVSSYAILHFTLSGVLGGNVASTAPFICFLIFASGPIDILTSFLRAQQKTGLYNLIAVIRRYGSICLGIYFVFYFIKGLSGYYFGQVIMGVIILGFLVVQFGKGKWLQRGKFSFGILKESIKFGIPLVWAEFGHLLLNYADRYLIQIFLGSIPLGLYTAGYNLSTHVIEGIAYPIAYAHTPIYTNILVSRGERETKEFLEKVFRYLLLVMIPLVFGFIAIGREVIAFLASKKYEAICPLLPYLVIGQSVYACSLILNDGLLIKKKTYVLTSVIIIGCVVNVGLNILLIPNFGILGAAIATLVSNVFYTVVITHYAFKEFNFKIDYRHIFLYFVAGCAMYFVMGYVNIESPLGNLGAKIATGVSVYSAGILVLDREVRSIFVKMIGRFYDRISCVR